LPREWRKNQIRTWRLNQLVHRRATPPCLCSTGREAKFENNDFPQAALDALESYNLLDEKLQAYERAVDRNITFP